MKTPGIPSRFACNRLALFSPALALLIVSNAGAQVSAPPTADTKKSAGADELVTLTPFTVGTDQDAGFAATSAIAGGRLASELRDTPVAYSVINREFIDALNLTDLQAAQNWATGYYQIM